MWELLNDHNNNELNMINTGFKFMILSAKLKIYHPCRPYDMYIADSRNIANV